MTRTSLVHVTGKSTFGQLARAAAVFSVTMTLGACSNYTTAPVCHGGNAVQPSGLTGVYTLSIQNDDFSVTTSQFTIGADRNGKMKMQGKDGDSDESQLCQVNSQLIAESYNDKVGGYEQQQLFITGMGLTQAAIFFDKAALDASGVLTQVIDMPESVKTVLGARLTAYVQRAAAFAAKLGGGKGLIVDNRGIPETVLMTRYGHTSPIGVSLLRQ